MKYPRARRPRRAHHWRGYVIDVDPDRSTMWLHLEPVGHHGIDVEAEFDRALLPDAERGTYITLYVHRRGRKSRTVLRKMNLPPWTQAEIDEVRRRARERYAEFRAMFDEATSA